MSEVCFWYGTSCHCGRMIGSASRHGSARHRLVFVELVFGYNDMVQTMESQNSSLVQTHRHRFEMESWRWAKNTFRCAGYLQPIWSQHIIWSEGNIYLCLSWRVGAGFLLEFRGTRECGRPLPGVRRPLTAKDSESMVCVERGDLRLDGSVQGFYDSNYEQS